MDGRIFLEALLLVGGGVLLYFGADFLIRGAVSLARKAGVSPLLIGLTLVAFGTSAPELVVSFDAALHAQGDIAVGNVVGSNICNIALILGVAALLRPVAVNPKLFRVDLPMMIGVTLLFVLFYFWDGKGINRWQGVAFLLILAGYLCWSFRHGGAEASEEMDAPLLSLFRSLLLIALGLAGLLVGARLFVRGAVFFATLFGVSQAVISLTVVALGTSLPELVTSVVAVLKNEKDIAIGNVVGSNIFNILVIMGLPPLVAPLSAPGISWIDLAVMLLTAIILWPMMATGKRISRMEGALLLLTYAAYTAWLFYGKNLTM